MPFGIVAYALVLFSWTTFLETAVYCCSINEQPLSLSVYQTILSEKQS